MNNIWLYKISFFCLCGGLISCSSEIKENSTLGQKYSKLEQLYCSSSVNEDSNRLAHDVKSSMYINMGIKEWSPQDHPNVAEYSAQLARKYGVNVLYMQHGTRLPANSSWLDVVGDQSIPKTEKANELYERMRNKCQNLSPFTANYFLTDSFQ